MKVVLKDFTEIKKKPISSLEDLVNLYKLSNKVEGKSPATIAWYHDLFTQFSTYLTKEQYTSDLSAINMDTVRNYVLHLRQKPKFEGHPFTPAQVDYLSPRTVQCHIRALKAFSSWVYSEGYTRENRLKNLKLPKTPTTIIKPLTPDETRIIIKSINRKTISGARDHAVFVTLLDTLILLEIPR